MADGEPSDDLVPISRVDRVYQDVRDAIIDGRYAPGAPLRLQDLTDEYGVSLIPIREALRRLEVERLVETTPNKGARVATISVVDVEDAYATRIVLEIEALRRAWPRLDRELIATLRSLRTDMLAGYSARDRRRAAATHKDLHFAIYRRSESEWLLHLIDILWSHTERYRRFALTLRKSLDEREDFHGRILDAIAAGDRRAATKHLEEDLARTTDLIVAWYRDRERT